MLTDQTAFPRWRLFWRTWFRTEQLLGSLPMMIITPTFAALVATVWTVATPDRVVVRGVTVLAPPSLGSSVLTAVLGGAIGICAVVGLIWIAVWVWYRVLNQSRGWSTQLSTYVESKQEEPFIRFALVWRGSSPVLTAWLGDVECWVKAPSGRFAHAMVDETDGLTFHGLTFQARTFGLPIEDGYYDVRWYVIRDGRQKYELSRGKVKLK